MGKKKIGINTSFSIVSILMSLFGFRVSNNYLDVIISSLAIFTGFYFTLIVYVTDKTVHKINEVERNPENEEVVSKLLIRFLDKYKRFSKSLISQISFSIVIAVFLIFVSFLTQTLTCECQKVMIKEVEIFPQMIYQIFITSIFLFLSCKLVHMILLIISNMQAFFFQEFDQSNKVL
ncbi:hypothetical protein [Fluviicola taffensis]|uniref:hypothetical protein n=1 Tax=Fluviicola taffensis TaxID=191579 RepID=UPI003137A8B6